MDLRGSVQVFNTEKFYHVHIANTYENATGVVMDLGVFTEIPFSDSPELTIAKFVNKTARDTQTSRGEFRRYHFHTAGPLNGSTTYQSLSVPGRQTDFFKINPHYNGRHYCYTYMSEWFHDDQSYASLAVLKQDLCKDTKTYWYRKNTYPGEATFIPRPGGASAPEDEGILVFPALDGIKRISLFVVLDAATLQELAVVELPQHIPFTAHGQFVPAAGRAAASAVANAGKDDGAVARAVLQSFTV